MGIYKALKASGSPSCPAKPHDAAKTVIANISPQAMKDVFEEVSIAGAGFINIKIKTSYLKSRVRYLSPSNLYS